MDVQHHILPENTHWEVENYRQRNEKPIDLTKMISQNDICQQVK